MPDGFSVDSYKLPVQKSPLEMAGQMGALQQQSLSINQQKLDQANQAFGYMTRAMTSLGPNATKDQYKAIGQSAAQMGLVPENMLHVWNAQVDQAPDSPTFFKRTIAAFQNSQQQLENYVGKSGLVNRGSDVIPVQTPGFTGAPVQTGNPIALGTSPEFNQTPETIFDPRSGTNKQGVRSQYTANAGVAPLSNNMYAKPSVGNPASAPNAAANAPNAPPLNAAPAIAQYSKELTDAPSLLDATKPIQQALPLLTQLGEIGPTGIGTEKGQKIISGLVNAGFISPESKAGKYAVNWQIVNKKLSNFIQSTPVAQRSDAAQILSEAGSPSVKNQLYPALVHLAQDAVATNLMKASRAMSFKNDPEFNGNQTEYPEYAAKRAAEQHPDAYKLYTYPESERRKIYASELKKADAGDKEAQRFIKSLVAAKKAGVLNVGP